jgi:hypothetical protein
MSASTDLVTRTTKQACTILTDVLGFKDLPGCSGGACTAEAAAAAAAKAAAAAAASCNYLRCNVCREESTCLHSAPEFNIEAKHHAQQQFWDLAVAAVAKAEAAASAKAATAAAVAAGASCNYFGCNVCREEATCPHSAPEFNHDTKHHVQLHLWDLAAAAAAKFDSFKAAAAAAVAAGASCNYFGCNVCRGIATCPYAAPELNSKALRHTQAHLLTLKAAQQAASTCKFVGSHTCRAKATCPARASEYRSNPQLHMARKATSAA